MTPEQIQELIDKLIAMGEALASEAFALALRQVWVDFGADVLLVLFLFSLAAVCFRASYKSEDEDAEGGLFAIGIFLVAAGVLLGVFGFKVAFNPEWYAIKNILRLLE